MTIVRRFVELHGGWVSAASAGRGQGSEFTVRLPLAATVAVPQRSGATGDAGKCARGARVLIVDDNADAADLLADSLAACGHVARTAYDAPAALEAAAAFDPDAALLDIGLPAMDGYELAQALREQLGNDLRLYALTGYGQEEDRARSQAAGFAGHFVKPVQVDELDRELRWLRDTEAGTTS